MIRMFFGCCLLAAAGCATAAPVPTRTVTITVPNPCVKVERVEGNAVYLRSGEGACAQVITRMPVQVQAGAATVRVYVDGRLWGEEKVD